MELPLKHKEGQGTPKIGALSPAQHAQRQHPGEPECEQIFCCLVIVSNSL